VVRLPADFPVADFAGRLDDDEGGDDEERR